MPHLLHEETYIYLQDAFHILKPSGKIVMSFLNCLEGKPLPFYGDGAQIRDWLTLTTLPDDLHAACCGCLGVLACLLRDFEPPKRRLSRS